MPSTPSSKRASLTDSNLDGCMIASSLIIFFIPFPFSPLGLTSWVQSQNRGLRGHEWRQPSTTQEVALSRTCPTAAFAVRLIGCAVRAGSVAMPEGLPNDEMTYSG